MAPDLDRPLQFAKRLRRRVYFADYHDVELHGRWLAAPTGAPYREQVYGVRPEPEEIRSVLVFKPDEIGDAVYALPAVTELRRAFPGARVSLLCQRLTRPLYERCGLFDEIVDVVPGTRFTRPHFPVEKTLRGFSASRFDMTVFLRTYPAYFRHYRRIPAGIRVHPVDPQMRSSSVHRAPISLWTTRRLHQSLQMLEIVGRVTGRSYGPQDVSFPPFAWTSEDRRAPAIAFEGDTPQRFVVVHPFAKHETRQYPLEYWERLLGELSRRVPVKWVVVGGPGDPQLAGVPDVIQVQGRLTLMQTGYLTSCASAFLGVLSGPVHMAGALGTPTLTIMSGHSLPAEWAPLGDSLVLRAEVPCAPCHQRTCPVYGLACLTALTPERILPQVERFILERTVGDRVAASRAQGPAA